MCRFVALAIAGILAGSSLAIAQPTSDNATLVVVLEKQTGLREVHLQPITPDRCDAIGRERRASNCGVGP